MATVSVLNTTSNLSAKTLAVAEQILTITGLWTFDRGANAPFAVGASSTKVANLDADKVDGLEAASFAQNPSAVDLVLSADKSLLRNTSDGSDTGRVSIGGGGARGQTRGGRVDVYGNEHSTEQGKVALVPGNVSGSKIEIFNNAGSVATFWDGATGLPSNLTNILNRDVVTTTVTNTTTETDLYSFSVPGGTLSTNRMLRLTAILDIVNTDLAATMDVNIKVVFGGTVLATGSRVFGINTTNIAFLEVVLVANNATNAQSARSRMHVRSTATGNAWFADGADPVGDWIAAKNATVDTTSDQIFQVTAQFAAADADFSVACKTAILELL